MSPPSKDTYTPSPKEELCRFAGSPVPTQTVAGSEGESAIAPMEVVVKWSKMESQVAPLFRVRNRPPDAVAA